MSWIQFENELNADKIDAARVGDQISLRAEDSTTLRLRKKELRKIAKALKMKLKFEKDEERIEMGTRPGTEGLWRNSRGHFAYARIVARQVPVSPHGWGRLNDYAIDYESTDIGPGTGLDLAVPGEPSDGFRSPSSNSGFGKKMGIRQGALHDREAQGFQSVLLGDATWYIRRSSDMAFERGLRLTLEDRLGRKLYPDEEAKAHNGRIVLTSRGW